MTRGVLTTLLLSGFGIAFFHAAIPTHWLPFVLTSRLRHWIHAKTLAITGFGTALSKTIGGWFPGVAGAILLLLGLFYLIRRPHGHLHLGPGRIHHCHDDSPDHRHEHDHAVAHVPSDRAAIGSLFAFLTFSPCEGFLPFYVSGIRYGWTGFGLLTATLSIGAILGMLLFTWLTLIGLAQVRMALLEKYESALMGILLCAVGLLILFLEY